ncbi:hypothetical protein BC940DRAFT_292434 [Gongronella butleri]|nr:hypothetical protein BC940DRAFT_292434 [Gongronella butleri]
MKYFVTGLVLLQLGLQAAATGITSWKTCNDNDIVSVTDLTLADGSGGWTLSAKGSVSTQVTGGTLTATLTPQGGSAQAQTLDLCTALGLVGHACPVAAGPLDLSQTIPSFLISAGTYQLDVSAVSKDSTPAPILCLNATFTLS